MRSQPSVLHLDLDAFFASVEQRDKPSLRGKPVIVGGVGARGVVSTASYEARVFGVHSAMPGHEARRRCPHAAFLSGRFDAYRVASRQVMTVLRDLSPLVEPLSLDEAFVDLAAARRPVDLSVPGLERLIGELKAEVAAVTGGLTASIGVGSSKFIAKVATELGKPDGHHIVPAGGEVALLSPMSARVIPGVGPVTGEKLRRIGVETVADLQRIALDDLVQVIGRAHGTGLKALAFAEDDRAVEPEREAKSISVEDTFDRDLVDLAELATIVDRDAHQVAARLTAARLLARTVTIKIRLHGFVTHTRSRTLTGGTDRAALISRIATDLLGEVDLTPGVRLVGVGVAGLTDVLQEDLFSTDDPEAVAAEPEVADDVPADGPVAVDPDPAAGADADRPAVTEHRAARSAGWPPGADVEHDVHGRGWVWGAGRGRVTVRFETADTPPGPVRTFADDDPALRRV
ncbi:DNA polymerase-4 [Friedmanniella endophytica]|uniref:DNA polymerase IV n=1 Tax=Microlunatus kandeliicorticis TaxID=1759536 RepID=A0A7W3IVM6_9ACTN|nr:DNA polymerase IV [Microlunatus kandeliicorticis]MBA8796082.1 DNA polymerase-4 [Microlunatus kandeliicorticis]